MSKFVKICNYEYEMLFMIKNATKNSIHIKKKTKQEVSRMPNVHVFVSLFILLFSLQNIKWEKTKSTFAFPLYKVNSIHITGFETW